MTYVPGPQRLQFAKAVEQVVYHCGRAGGAQRDGVVMRVSIGVMGSRLCAAVKEPGLRVRCSLLREDLKFRGTP